MREHLDYPVTVTIHFRDSEIPAKKYHCDMLGFLDAMGNWVGVFVEGEPIFSVPRDMIKYIETVNNDEEESAKETTH